MTPELDYSGQMGGHGSPEYAEHEIGARAKRVISVFGFPADASGILNKAPITGSVAATSASITLVPGKLYRIASTTNSFIRLSTGASTAVNTDFILPAFQPVFVKSTIYDTLSFIRSTADGTIQAVEVV